MTATQAPHSVQCPSCESWFPIAPERVPEEGVAAICSHCMRVFRVERPAQGEVDPFGADPLEADAHGAETVEVGGLEGETPEAEELEQIPVEVDDARAEALEGSPSEPSGPDGPVEARDPADAMEASDAIEQAEGGSTVEFAVSDDAIDTAGYAVGEEAVEDTGTDDVELETEPVQPAPDPGDPMEIDATTTDFVEEAEEVSEDDDDADLEEETEWGLDQESSGAEIDLEEDDAASEPEFDPMPEAEPMPEVEPMAGVEETGGVPEEKVAERARPEETSPVREQSLSRAAARFGRRDPHDRAKRLARVLVSDMLTYHPARYEEALAEGTLKEHFADEIRLSWEEYEEQIGSDLAESTDYFIQALNEILARGERLFRGIGRPE